MLNARLNLDSSTEKQMFDHVDHGHDVGFCSIGIFHRQQRSRFKNQYRKSSVGFSIGVECGSGSGVEKYDFENPPDTKCYACAPAASNFPKMERAFQRCSTRVSSGSIRRGKLISYEITSRSVSNQHETAGNGFVLI
jgi:hypothetical protein